MTETAPLVYLLPGAGGYFLDLVRFVEALSSAAKVEALDYAPIDPAALRIIRFDELVADVIGPIRSSAQRGEPVRLLGRSLGGFVALEVARTLAAEGHTIEFVGLLDTSTMPLRWDLSNKSPEAVPAHLVRQVNQPMLTHLLRSARNGKLFRARPTIIFVRLLEKLLHGGRFSTLRSIWWLLQRAELRNASVLFSNTAKVYLHGNTIISRRWPLRYDGRVTLFRSEDREWDRLEMPEDLGWNEFCRDVSVRRVPGDHMSMISAANVGATARAVTEALREARGSRAASAMPGSISELTDFAAAVEEPNAAVARAHETGAAPQVCS